MQQQLPVLWQKSTTEMNPAGTIGKDHTVFLGDSLTEGFDLERYFPGHATINRGISGDTTFEVIYRMDEILNAGPKKLFLMIGINDIFSGHSQDAILDNIQHIIWKFQDTCPQTKVYVQSILPIRNENLLIDDSGNVTIYQMNNRLKSLCKESNVKFIDLYPDFLDNNGQLDRKYTFDGAHLTEEGYGLWAEVVIPYI